MAKRVWLWGLGEAGHGDGGTAMMAGHGEAAVHPHRAKGGSFPSIRDTNKPKNKSAMTIGHGGVQTTARHVAEHRRVTGDGGSRG